MYPEKPKNSTQKVAAGLVITFAVVLLVFIAHASTDKPQTQTISNQVTPTTTSTATDNTTSTNTSTSTSTVAYKDGTYTGSSEYYVPHGYESIQVTVTIKSGVVTDSSIVNSESNRESQSFQQDFASVYKSYVTGKSIDSINLSRVAGASDTAQGFNDAITNIENQAKA